MALALIRRVLRDDLEQVAVAESQLASDFDDIAGSKGYARKPVMRERRVDDMSGVVLGDEVREW